LERRLSMKSYEDVTKICQEKKTLTDDERRKEIEFIKTRIKSRQDELVSRQKEREDLQKKVDEIADRRRSISRQISASGEMIPKMLGYDIDPGKVLETEKKLVEEDRLLARTSAGLQTRLNDLKREMDLLATEGSEDEFLLKIFRVVPLPDLLNTNGVERGKLTEELCEALDELGCSLYPGSGGLKVVIVSDFDSVEKVPRFFLCGDERPEDRDGSGRLKNVWWLREFISPQRVRKQIDHHGPHIR
jgi:hypothetical protein